MYCIALSGVFSLQSLVDGGIVGTLFHLLDHSNMIIKTNIVWSLMVSSQDQRMYIRIQDVVKCC